LAGTTCGLETVRGFFVFCSTEAARQRALEDLQLLDTAAEQEFDDITLLASFICGTPIALMSLVDKNRQWFKNRVGLDVPETPRDIALCAHAILGDGIFEVTDAAMDERFKDNPVVTWSPSLRWAKSMSGASRLAALIEDGDGEGHELATGFFDLKGGREISAIWHRQMVWSCCQADFGMRNVPVQAEEDKAPAALPESQAPSIFPPAKLSPARMRGAGRSKESAGGSSGGRTGMA
jgi:hypothetical protein